MSDRSSKLLSDLENWWEDLTPTQKYFIYTALVAVGVAEVLRGILSDFAAGFWAGVAIYGILNMVWGDTEILDSRTSSEIHEFFGYEIDSVIGAQVLAVTLSISVVASGRLLKPLVQHFIGSFSELQAIGALVLVSRLAIIVIREEPLQHGKWSKSVYTLGGGFIVFPPIIAYLLPTTTDIISVFQLAMPLALFTFILLIEERIVDPKALF